MPLARQFYNKRAAASRGILNEDLSPVRFYNFSSDTKAKSKVAFFAVGLIRAIKTFKNMFFFGVWNTNSVICHGKPEVFSIKEKGELNPSIL